MNAPIKVLLVDDHPVVRTGYRHLLQTDADIEVIGEAHDSVSAYEAFKLLGPDVVVMDISLPGASGIEALKRIRAHEAEACVLIFSMHDEAIFISRAMRCGAAGYLSKSSAPEKLLDAVRAVARGERYFADGQDAAGEREADRPAATALLGELSHRETEVLRMWAQGLGLEEIARRLGVSEKTVANYQSLVRQKLNVQNDVQLLRLATKIWFEGAEEAVRS
ncbi:MAG TPA: response regulator transcription factor [Steroidobacteraceae bacterium]|nr:response regulator transcription factor [Steroidobacteraceae bacterium]